MPDTTQASTEETQPGAGSINQGEQGADSIVKEPLTWWEQKLQTLSPEDRESITGKLKGYDKEVSRRLNQIRQREMEIASVAEKLEKVSQARPQAAMTQAKSESVGIIDRLIDEAGNADNRETLEKLRVAIRQESNRDALEKKIEKLETLIVQSQTTSSLTHEQVLSKELKGLEGEYGQELIEKHADLIKAYGSKPENHTFSAEKLLLSVADPAEVKQALKVQSRRQAEPNKLKGQTPLTGSSPQHPSEKFRGKTAREIQAGVGNAITEAVAIGLKKRLGTA